MIRFPFEPEKARASAEVLVHDERGHMDVVRLMKLLYKSERMSLERRRAPIFGGDLVSMRFGPVASQAYELVNSGIGRLRREGHNVVFSGEPEVGPLSDWELRLLREVSDLHRDVDDEALIDAMHQLPEWVDPRRTGVGRVPIQIDALLRILGAGPDEIERVTAEAEELRQLRELGL